VYACIAHLDGSAEGLFAVANIGFRPTLGEDNASAPIVEVHLLDFEGELYGRRVEVEFVTTLRGERRFSGIEELREQITRDIATARSVLEAELRPHI
jgi:riboflavin kinase/FMN adenylyltransferase